MHPTDGGRLSSWSYQARFGGVTLAAIRDPIGVSLWAAILDGFSGETCMLHCHRQLRARTQWWQCPRLSRSTLAGWRTSPPKSRDLSAVTSWKLCPALTRMPRALSALEAECRVRHPPECGWNCWKSPSHIGDLAGEHGQWFELAKAKLSLHSLSRRESWAPWAFLASASPLLTIVRMLLTSTWSSWVCPWPSGFSRVGNVWRERHCGRELGCQTGLPKCTPGPCQLLSVPHLGSMERLRQPSDWQRHRFQGRLSRSPSASGQSVFSPTVTDLGNAQPGCRRAPRPTAPDSGSSWRRT